MKSLVTSIAVTAVVIAVSLFFVVDKDSAAEAKLDSVESMVVGLEARLQDQPDDGKGWLLLAKSYRHMGRMDDAREAYKKAEALDSGDAKVAAQLYGLDSAGTVQ